MLGLALRAWKPPAACQDEPAVRTERSTSATSLHPYFVKW